MCSSHRELRGLVRAERLRRVVVVVVVVGDGVPRREDVPAHSEVLTGEGEKRMKMVVGFCKRKEKVIAKREEEEKKKEKEKDEKEKKKKRKEEKEKER